MQLKLVAIFLAASLQLALSITDDEKDDIRRFIRHTINCNNVPGFTVTVVDNNKIEMTEAFGSLDIESDDALADAHSSFSIGSLSKAFTAALMTKVLEKSNFNMDSLLKDIVPELNLGNDINTNQATIRDLLSHKLGYLGYGFTWAIGLDPVHSRQEYCGRLNHIKSIGFRWRYRYSNFMLTLAGCIIERISGKTYEEVFKTELADPLEMRDTDLISNINNWDWKKFASPHSYDDIDSRLKRIDRINIESVLGGESSGGIFSSATDMANWILVNLNEGKFKNKTIFNRDALLDIHSPQFASNFDPNSVRRPYFPVENSQTTYGLGWSIGTYGGYRASMHGGSINGFNSLIYLYPDIKSGVFVGGNTYASSNTMVAVTYYISDILQGRKPFINDTTACTYPEPWINNIPKSALPEKEKSRFDIPPLSFTNHVKMNAEKYTGEYGHPLFANTTVWYDESEESLKAKSGHIGYAKLLPTIDEQIFVAKLIGPIEFIVRKGNNPNMTFPLVFQSDSGGKYQKLWNVLWETQDPVIFERGLLWNN